VLSAVPVNVPLFPPELVFVVAAEVGADEAVDAGEEADADGAADGDDDGPAGVGELLSLVLVPLSALPPSAVVVVLVVDRDLNDSSRPRPTAVSSSASTTFRMTFPV
jgi:hypothetical protein